MPHQFSKQLLFLFLQFFCLLQCDFPNSRLSDDVRIDYFIFGYNSLSSFDLVGSELEGLIDFK